MPRYVKIEIPDGLSDPDAKVLVRDALANFIAKRLNAREYVMRAYGDNPYLNSPEWLEQKVDEVLKRVDHASAMLETVQS